MTPTRETERRRQWWILIALAVGLGAVGGGTFAFFAVRDEAINPWWGLLMGVAMALAILLIGGVILRRTAPLVDALAGLDKDERKAVGRAVNRGRAVDDLRLAPAAILMAEQQLSPVPGPEWVKNGILLMALGALSFATAALSGRGPGVVLGVGMFVLGLSINRLRVRTRVALDANQRLLDA